MAARRVANFAKRAQEQLTAYAWPAGVTTLVEGETVWLFGPAGARTRVLLDAYSLASVVPDRVRCEAARKLAAQSRDERYTEKSRAADAHMAAALAGEVL